MALVTSLESGAFAGLWVGEATPVEQLEGEVPSNPIKWCMLSTPEPARGMPAIYGSGYFDDSGDVPGQPVLFYTLKGTVGGAPGSAAAAAFKDGRGEMLKVYEPPVPEILTVRYSDMSLSADGGHVVLSGRWTNELEGTAGTFKARLVDASGALE